MSGTGIASKFGTLRELLVFLWRRRLWWLIPLVLVLVLFGILTISIAGSSIAPFIYSLF